MENIKKYQIGDKTYTQGPLVLGQIRQLVTLLEGMEIRWSGGIKEIIAALGDKLTPALAIVLTEEGKSPRYKDIAALAAELEFTMTPDDLFSVIDDFFALNPVSSLLERFAAMMETATGAIRTGADGLTGSLSPLPVGTSPDGTPSNGATPSVT